MVTLVLAIVGIAVSLFLYFHPNRDRAISVTWSDASRIYDSHSTTSKISLIDASDAAIQQDVSVITLSLWNSGSEPIEPSEVRKPIKIVNAAPCRILDASVVKEKDAQVSRFSVEPDFDSSISARRSVLIKWEHLDPGHGAKIQVLYAAATPADFALEGEVLGVNRFSRIQALSSRIKLFALIFLVVNVAYGVFMVRYVARRSDSPVSRIARLAGILHLGMSVVVGCFVLWAVLNRTAPQF